MSSAPVRDLTHTAAKVGHDGRGDFSKATYLNEARERTSCRAS